MPGMDKEYQSKLYLKRSKMCCKLSKFALAREDVEESLELHPSVEGHIQQAMVLQSLDRIEEAIAVLKTAQSNFPRAASLSVVLRNLIAKKAYADTRQPGDDVSQFIAQVTTWTDPEVLAANRDDAMALDHAGLKRRSKLLNESQPYILGGHRLRDEGNIVQAIKCYEKAAAMRAPEAMYNLACCLLPNKQHPLVDPVRALALLKEVASMPPGYIAHVPGWPAHMDKYMHNLGVPEAENTLGCCYRDGCGVDVDLVEARKWFARAAKHGCDNGMNSLGMMLSGGQGGSVDKEAAAEYFERSAKLKNSRAAFNLALMLSSGNGIAQDLESAQRWCREAVRGHAPGARMLLETIERAKAHAATASERA